MQRMGLTSGRKGFTLIELLVVIAIIAILAAILFPVFSKARAKAQQISCLSNVKQQALAVRMYLSDWDQVFPLGYTGGLWDWGSAAGLTVELMPYIGSEDITSCPATGGRLYTYNYNANVFGNTWGFLYGLVSINDVKQPSQVIMLCDSGCEDYYDIRFMVDQCLRSKHNAVPSRHNGGDNFGLVDGHAKWFKTSDSCDYGGCDACKYYLPFAADPNFGGAGASEAACWVLPDVEG